MNLSPCWQRLCDGPARRGAARCLPAAPSGQLELPAAINLNRVRVAGPARGQGHRGPDDLVDRIGFWIDRGTAASLSRR